MQLDNILYSARQHGSSDIHLLAGLPPAFRVNGDVIVGEAQPLTEDVLKSIVEETINDEQRRVLARDLQLCFSINHKQFGRFRTSIYFRNGSPEMAIRICNNNIWTREELGLPKNIDELLQHPAGLILITGPTGSGKTTTLSYMIDYINSSRNGKIVTIEDPIEYVHSHKKGIIVQQELHTDVINFQAGLHHVLRQDPDVIGIGELRNMDTIATALTAAETGHLVIATLHTSSIAQTVERIIGVFPPGQQGQAVLQLANSLQGIIAQQLVPSVDKKRRVLAYELLLATPGIRHILRSNEGHKLYTILETSSKLGMCTMDYSLCKHYDNGEISYDALMSRVVQQEQVKAKYNRALV
ncbi:MAG: PilT/PilU family type 4a pilus ATPase [Victivallaceae bacterium]